MNFFSSLRFVAIAFASAFIVVSCQSAPPTNPSANQPTQPAQETVTQQMSDEQYMTDLGLMKGHLIVAKELLDQNKPEQAEPHIGHPVEEIYGQMESEYQRRNVPEFKGTLNELHDLVKTAPNSPEINTKYQAAIDSVDKAIAILPQEKRESPEFVLKVIPGLLATAEEEYGAAIVDNKIAEAIEYQDSRGFVSYADSLYQQVSEPLKQQNAAAYQDLSSKMEELKKAWPTAVPPAQPVMTSQKVSELIDSIKNSSEQFYAMKN